MKSKEHFLQNKAKRKMKTVLILIALWIWKCIEIALEGERNPPVALFRSWGTRNNFTVVHLLRILSELHHDAVISLIEKDGFYVKFKDEKLARTPHCL